MICLLLYLSVQESLFWERTNSKTSYCRIVSLNYVMENSGTTVVMEANKSSGSISWAEGQAGVGHMEL